VILDDFEKNGFDLPYLVTDDSTTSRQFYEVLKALEALEPKDTKVARECEETVGLNLILPKLYYFHFVNSTAHSVFGRQNFQWKLQYPTK
jgi:hypothetical protein